MDSCIVWYLPLPSFCINFQQNLFVAQYITISITKKNKPTTTIEYKNNNAANCSLHSGWMDPRNQLGRKQNEYLGNPTAMKAAEQCSSNLVNPSENIRKAERANMQNVVQYTTGGSTDGFVHSGRTTAAGGLGAHGEDSGYSPKGGSGAQDGDGGLRRRYAEPLLLSASSNFLAEDSMASKRRYGDHSKMIEQGKQEQKNAASRKQANLYKQEQVEKDEDKYYYRSRFEPDEQVGRRAQEREFSDIFPGQNEQATALGEHGQAWNGGNDKKPNYRSETVNTNSTSWLDARSEIAARHLERQQAKAPILAGADGAADGRSVRKRNSVMGGVYVKPVSDITSASRMQVGPDGERSVQQVGSAEDSSKRSEPAEKIYSSDEMKGVIAGDYGFNENNVATGPTAFNENKSNNAFFGEQKQQATFAPAPRTGSSSGQGQGRIAGLAGSDAAAQNPKSGAQKYQEEFFKSSAFRGYQDHLNQYEMPATSGAKVGGTGFGAGAVEGRDMNVGYEDETAYAGRDRNVPPEKGALNTKKTVMLPREDGDAAYGPGANGTSAQAPGTDDLYNTPADAEPAQPHFTGSYTGKTKFRTRDTAIFEQEGITAEKANAFQRKLNDLSSHKTAEVMYNRKFNQAAQENMHAHGAERTHGKYVTDTLVGTHGERVVMINERADADLRGNEPAQAEYPFYNPGANQTGNSPGGYGRGHKSASWNAKEARQNVMRGSLNLFGGDYA